MALSGVKGLINLRSKSARDEDKLFPNSAGSTSDTEEISNLARLDEAIQYNKTGALIGSNRSHLAIG